jgi:hypothetical protein
MSEKMKVLELATYEGPKSDEGLKKLHEFNEEVKKYWDERLKEFKVNRTVWSDGTGKYYSMYEYASYQTYAQFHDDEETQRIISGHFRLVSNGKRRVLREVVIL